MYNKHIILSKIMKEWRAGFPKNVYILRVAVAYTQVSNLRKEKTIKEKN